jgi:hypothetical protein
VPQGRKALRPPGFTAVRLLLLISNANANPTLSKRSQKTANNRQKPEKKWMVFMQSSVTKQLCMCPKNKRSDFYAEYCYGVNFLCTGPPAQKGSDKGNRCNGKRCRQNRGVHGLGGHSAACHEKQNDQRRLYKDLRSVQHRFSLPQIN